MSTVAKPQAGDWTPMTAGHLQELIDLEDYWWHAAKRELACALLQDAVPHGGRVLEGGFGSAGNLREFQRLGYETSGFDCMPEAVLHAQQSGLRNVSCQDLEKPWPVESASLASVLLLDVIEHLAEPVTALGEAARCLQPGGSVIVTVPAYPWMYGPWDRALGHYRRYTRSLLKTHAEQAGLKVRRLTYWNSFTLPAAVATRLYQKLFPRESGAEFPRVPGWLNSLLKTCARVERKLLFRTGVPAGLSLAGVLEK